MSAKGQMLQDPFLNILRKEHIPVSIYLVNGIKLQGQVESFDQYVVLLKNTVTQMVYKHAISTVVPARPVNIPFEHPSDADLRVSSMFERPGGADAAVLVSLDFGDADYAESLEELQRLAESAGVQAVAASSRASAPVQMRHCMPVAAKCEEIAEALQQSGAGLVIFNHEISAAQQRNLEQRLETPRGRSHHA